MKKKIPITYSIDRVVLSDVLPYETPVTFSNRYFYKYLLERKKCAKNKEYREKNKKAFSDIENILFGTGPRNTPFSFNIGHKNHDFRELNIVHPINQINILDFYKEYKELILYYCSISPYSIRKPYKVANYIFYNDILHKRTKDGDLEHSQIEQDESEYENLKSFFTYRKYSNIHKFFESYQFHRSEKKYNKLLKIDISKCFDSIYTHTISWAVFNKDIVKENIRPSLNTFAGKFDAIMQQLNANETNGIVIGPEFSRIFAEIILQQIDKTIFENLRIKDENGLRLIHKIDYEIFRYVDDYFIFFNDDNHSKRILKEFKLSLKSYKMYVNDNKSISYQKPIITDISIAKQKISDLFNDHLVLVENKKETEEKEETTLIHFSSSNVITRFKTIIKETEIDYKDIMNYTLAVLDKKTAKLINKFKMIDPADRTTKNEKIFEKGLLEILDVSFFLYSVSPKVNSTIKICLILNKIITFLRKNRSNNYTEPFLPNNKHTVLKKISDEIYLILEKNKTKKETQIETLYLLIAYNQLGREYRLNHALLCSYFNIEKANKKLKLKGDLNYFSITVLLFYIKDIKSFESIRKLIKTHIYEKFDKASHTEWRSQTELVLLLLDVMTCPYLNEKLTPHLKNKIKDAKARKSKNLKLYLKQANDHKYGYKKKLLSLLGYKNHINIIEQERFWFTKWIDFDFGLELQAKRSQEVY